MEETNHLEYLIKGDKIHLELSYIWGLQSFNVSNIGGLKSFKVSNIGGLKSFKVSYIGGLKLSNIEGLNHLSYPILKE